MTQRFVIALSLNARRSGVTYDLESEIRERFHEVRIIERAYGGSSITVEMPARLQDEIRHRLPFVSVSPAAKLALLSRVAS
jgi:hypothetical protein